MNVPAWTAAIGWAGTAAGGVTMFVKNAKKVEQAVYGAVREVKDLQVLSRVDLNNINKSLRALDQRISASLHPSAKPAAPKAPAKKAVAKKAPAKRTAK